MFFLILQFAFFKTDLRNPWRFRGHARNSISIIFGDAVSDFLIFRLSDIEIDKRHFKMVGINMAAN